MATHHRQALGSLTQELHAGTHGNQGGPTWPWVILWGRRGNASPLGFPGLRGAAWSHTESRSSQRAGPGPGFYVPDALSKRALKGHFLMLRGRSRIPSLSVVVLEFPKHYDILLRCVFLSCRNSMLYSGNGKDRGIQIQLVTSQFCILA